MSHSVSEFLIYRRAALLSEKEQVTHQYILIAPMEFPKTSYALWRTTRYETEGDMTEFTFSLGVLDEFTGRAANIRYGAGSKV
jgi:hypothetical protein